METRMIVFIVFSAVMGILAINRSIQIWNDITFAEYSETVIAIIRQIAVKVAFVCICYFIFM